MWEIILEAKLFNLHKPGSSRIRKSGKNILSDSVQYVLLESANHGENCQLSNVEEAPEWEGAGKEENNWLWCSRVELLESFQDNFIVMGEDIHFRFEEEETTKT